MSAAPVPTAWATMIDEYTAAMTAWGRKPRTIETVRKQLRHAARGIGGDPGEVDPEAVGRWLDAQVWSDNHRRDVRCALHCFFRWGSQTGRLHRALVAAVAPPRQRGSTVLPAGSPEWEAAIAAYLQTLIAAGFSKRTLELRRDQLRYFSRQIGLAPTELTGELVVAWMGEHVHWANEYRRNVRNGLKSFLVWEYKTGRLDRYYADLPKVRMIAGVPRPAPDSAWVTGISNASPSIVLAMRLAAEAGLRRAEVAQVHTRDLIDGVAGAQLLVHGKGGKKRVVPLSESLAAELRRRAAGHTAGASQEGWLFPGDTDGHLTPKRLGTLVSEALPVGWTMHTLRHRFASRAYRGTRNLRAVQVLLGHQSIATTQIYCAVDDSEIRATMEAAGA